VNVRFPQGATAGLGRSPTQGRSGGSRPGADSDVGMRRCFRLTGFRDMGRPVLWHLSLSGAGPALQEETTRRPPDAPWRDEASASASTSMLVCANV
jgi:hypothetical protein